MLFSFEHDAVVCSSKNTIHFHGGPVGSEIALPSFGKRCVHFGLSQIRVLNEEVDISRFI